MQLSGNGTPPSLRKFIYVLPYPMTSSSSSCHSFSDTVTFTSLHPTRNALYALGIATYPGPPSSSPTYVIQVVSISPRTGETIAHAVVPSQITSPSSYLVLSAPSLSNSSSSGSSSGSLQAKLKEALKAASSSSTSHLARIRVVWLDATENTLKSLPLSPRLDRKGAAIKGEEFVSFQDIGLARPTVGAEGILAGSTASELKTSLVTPKFLATRTDGSVRVLGLDEQGGITGDFILGDTVCESSMHSFAPLVDLFEPRLGTTKKCIQSSRVMLIHSLGKHISQGHSGPQRIA